MPPKAPSRQRPAAAAAGNSTAHLQHASNTSQNASHTANITRTLAGSIGDDVTRTSSSISAEFAPARFPPTGQSRPAVQRLDSLSRRGGLSAGSVPSVPAASGIKHKPKATVVRRSQQERDQAEREEQQRIAAKSTTAWAAQNASQDAGMGRGRGWARGRGQTGARAGLRSNAMRPPARFGEGMASGPFGAGSVLSRDKVPLSRVKRELSRKSSRRNKQSGVKRDEEGDVDMADGERQISGTHELGYGSSTDEEEKDEGPRVDIEHINLISDDEDEQDSGRGKGRMPERRSRGLRPIRLDARDHVERTAGARVSMDQGGRAEERIDDEPLFVPRDYELEKGRRRLGKDVEFLRDGRAWRGVYQDAEEVQVKQEPTEESSTLGVANEPRHIERADSSSSNTIEADLATQANPSEQGTVRPDPKPKSKKTSKPSEPPVFQTNEDREEWLRRQRDLEWIRAELGSFALKSTEDQSAVDREGDVSMEPDLAETSDPKYGKLYLFQFPPNLPAVFNPIKADEASDSQAQLHQVTTLTSDAPDPSANTEADSVTDAKHPSTTSTTDVIPIDAIDAAGSTATGSTPRFPSGKVGKLAVHASGRAYLTWGNIRLEISRGMQAQFLQDVVSVDKEGGGGGGGVGAGPSAERAGGFGGGDTKDGGRLLGKAVALGAIAGKLNLSPHWDDLFRGRD